MKRPLALAVLAVGALGLVIVANVLSAGGGVAIGWAAAAGAFLMLMLRGQGLRAMGILLVLLGLGAGLLGAVQGGPGWLLVLPAALLVVGGVAAARWGPDWPVRAGSGPRDAPRDQWKQFDAGEDPTAPDVVPGDDPR